MAIFDSRGNRLRCFSFSHQSSTIFPSASSSAATLKETKDLVDFAAILNEVVRIAGASESLDS